MFKNKGLPLFYELQAIFTGTVATGKYSHGANESESDNAATDDDEEGDDDVEIIEPDEEGEQEGGAEGSGESDGDEGAAGSATPLVGPKKRPAGTPASAASAAAAKKGDKKQKKNPTPPLAGGGTKSKAAGPPSPKKVKLGIGEQLVAGVNAMAAAMQSGSSAEINGRTAAIKSFNNTAIAKMASASQRLAFKSHLVQGQNYVLFNMLDFTSKDGIAEVEEYVIGVVTIDIAIETVDVDDGKEE
jgi:hypothetical protein